MFADFNWAEASVDFIIYALLVALGWAVARYKASPGAQEKAEGWIEKLRGMAADYIAKAEATYKGTKRGGEKFEWVVTALYRLLPDAVTPFISRETVGDIVQGVFDSIATYATIQMDKWVNDTLSDDDKELFGKEDSNAKADNAV